MIMIHERELLLLEQLGPGSLFIYTNSQINLFTSYKLYIYIYHTSLQNFQFNQLDGRLCMFGFQYHVWCSLDFLSKNMKRYREREREKIEVLTFLKLLKRTNEDIILLMQSLEQCLLIGKMFVE